MQGVYLPCREAGRDARTAPLVTPSLGTMPEGPAIPWNGAGGNCLVTVVLFRKAGK